MKYTETIITQQKPSFNEQHQCDNKPELKELVEYSKKTANNWEEIALHLNVSADKIGVINIDGKDSVELKCRKMFNTCMAAIKYTFPMLVSLYTSLTQSWTT